MQQERFNQTLIVIVIAMIILITMIGWFLFHDGFRFGFHHNQIK